MTDGFLLHGLCHKKAIVAFLQDNLRWKDTLPVCAIALAFAESNGWKSFLLGPDSSKPGRALGTQSHEDL